jgi:hypothetical protein
MTESFSFSDCFIIKLNYKIIGKLAVVHKFLFLFILSVSSLHATELLNSDKTQLALGDIGSVKSSLTNGLSDGASSNQMPMKSWSELTDSERKVLAPLGDEWDTLRPWQREKMLDIAKDYPSMDMQKQQRVQNRLNSWSRMTPYERENARKRYQQFHSLSDEKKAEVRKKWVEHKKLPEAEREKLRKESIDWESDIDL